jgi:hypothetical protein
VPGDRGGGAALLAELGPTRPLGRAVRTLHGSAALDLLDRLASSRRSRLGRLVPDGPGPRRYP